MEPSKPHMLEVADSEEWTDFLANAKKAAREAWERRNPGKRKQRGRRHDDRIINAIKEVYQSGAFVKTIGGLVILIKEKFKNKPDPPHTDSIRKYAKLFILLRKVFENSTQLTPDHSRWVAKHFPASDMAISDIFEAMRRISPRMQRISKDFDQIIATLAKSGIRVTDAFRRILARFVLLD